MKYLKALYFILKTVTIAVLVFGGCKLLFVTCAALDPMLTAVTRWMADRAIVIATVIVIAFILWIFGDACDEQKRKEKSR